MHRPVFYFQRLEIYREVYLKCFGWTGCDTDRLDGRYATPLDGQDATPIEAVGTLGVWIPDGAVCTDPFFILKGLRYTGKCT